MNATDILSGGKTVALAVFVESAVDDSTAGIFDCNLSFLPALHLLTLLTRSKKFSSVRYFLVRTGSSATNLARPFSALSAL